MADGFQVYFKSGTCDLNAAVRALTGYGLKVQTHEGYVTVSRPGSPAFDVGISTEAWVGEEAAEIGAGTPHAAAMRACDARFEVSFESLPWNGNLSGPSA